MKPSVVRRLSRLPRIQSLMILAVMVLFIIFSLRSAYEERIVTMNNALQLEQRSMEEALHEGDMLLRRLIYDNDNYSLLQSDSDSTRYFAAFELKEMLLESVSYSTYVDAAAIAESTYESSLIRCKNPNASANVKDALTEHTMREAGKGAERARWQLARIGEEDYFCKLFIWNHTAVGVYINTELFMDVAGDLLQEKGIGLFLLDQDERLWASSEPENTELKKYEAFTEQKNFLKSGGQVKLSGTDFQLLGRISRSTLFESLREYLFLLILLLAILIGFSIIMTGRLRREVIRPISQIEDDLEALGRNRLSHVHESYDSREFETLSSTLNRQLDTIRNLRISSYEKQLALQETELRAVKLQIRPHFFLNAMTTISSLSQQGKNTEIGVYISALAKNIRYMFRTGLHTVALSEEITHVENYFDMQELKYPGCVFHAVELMPGCEDWAVPQMLVHTIVENEYKYAVSVDQMLSILIQAERVTEGEEELLRLTIEDDGAGYPAEVLEAFSVKSEEMTESADGKRVGLWSLRRMLFLMYERDDLFRIENIEPHGCRNIFLLPARPLHQVKEIPQVKID